MDNHQPDDLTGRENCYVCETCRGVLNTVHHDELPLFVEAKARRTDPVTSHDAAESMTHAAGVQRALILNALAKHGPQTADALDELLSFRPTTAGRRCSELVKAARIHVTGELRPTRSNRDAQVYARTESQQ